MKSLRVILVMIEPPLPFGHATARWSYALLKGLVERGHRVVAFTTIREAHPIDELKALFPPPDFDLRCYQYPVRGRFRSKWETIQAPCAYMFSSALRRDLEAELEHDFDVLHLESTWTGWLALNRDRARTLLNCHNLYSIDQPIAPLHCITERLRATLQRCAEQHLLKNYPTLITLTPRLQHAIQAIAPAASVRVVPLGLDLSLYPFVPAERRPAQPVVSMIGSMNWYPSLSAAIRLLTRLWPAIKQRVRGARLAIVGRDARSALADYLQHSDVDIAENVPSTRPYFEASSVLLYAPDRASGMKVKVLEAFAYGVPVVTTSDGVEGLPAQDGVHASFCDDDNGLIERAVGLLTDPLRQECQRRAARELLERECGARVALDAVERCYTEIVARSSLPA